MQSILNKINNLQNELLAINVKIESLRDDLKAFEDALARLEVVQVNNNENIDTLNAIEESLI